eukprot:scaffold64_cov248-Pinguiococcus_pyrenoidosus.AAC.2
MAKGAVASPYLPHNTASEGPRCALFRKRQRPPHFPPQALLESSEKPLQPACLSPTRHPGLTSRRSYPRSPALARGLRSRYYEASPPPSDVGAYRRQPAAQPQLRQRRAARRPPSSEVRWIGGFSPSIRFYPGLITRLSPLPPPNLVAHWPSVGVCGRFLRPRRSWGTQGSEAGSRGRVPEAQGEAPADGSGAHDATCGGGVCVHAVHDAATPSGGQPERQGLGGGRPRRGVPQIRGRDAQGVPRGAFLAGRQAAQQAGRLAAGQAGRGFHAGRRASARTAGAEASREAAVGGQEGEAEGQGRGLGGVGAVGQDVLHGRLVRRHGRDEQLHRLWALLPKELLPRRAAAGRHRPKPGGARHHLRHLRQVRQPRSPHGGLSPLPQGARGSPRRAAPQDPRRRLQRRQLRAAECRRGASARRRLLPVPLPVLRPGAGHERVGAAPEDLLLHPCQSGSGGGGDAHPRLDQVGHGPRRQVLRAQHEPHRSLGRGHRDGGLQPHAQVQRPRLREEVRPGLQAHLLLRLPEGGIQDRPRAVRRRRALRRAAATVELRGRDGVERAKRRKEHDYRVNSLRLGDPRALFES